MLLRTISPRKFLQFLLVSLFMLGNLATISAQQTTSYTEDDLKQFAQAAYKILTIQEESQVRMINAIEETDLSLDRFNEMLLDAQQGGEEAVNGTEDELQAFNESLNQVQNIQYEMQLEMMEAINEEGMDISKYQQLMVEYEQDENTRRKVDQYLEEIE